MPNKALPYDVKAFNTKEDLHNTFSRDGYTVNFSGKSKPREVPPYSISAALPISYLPVGSYSVPTTHTSSYNPSQQSHSLKNAIPTNTQPIDAGAFLAVIQGMVNDMKHDSRDLDYEDYLFRQKRADREAEKRRMFQAYGG